MQQDLLTMHEAARIAHVSAETIKYWSKTGRLKTVPIRISERSGKPYGQLVPRNELLKAMPMERARLLKESHPGNLLTVREISRALRIRDELVYSLVKRYGLEKHKVDGCQYMVDGEELWRNLGEDSCYWHLSRPASSTNRFL